MRPANGRTVHNFPPTEGQAKEATDPQLCLPPTARKQSNEQNKQSHKKSLPTKRLNESFFPTLYQKIAFIL